MPVRSCLPAAAAALLLAGATLSCAGSASSVTEVDSNRGGVPPVHAPTLTQQQSGTTNRLQAVSPVNQKVVWASGTGGTWVRTTDGGATWQAGVVPGAETLQFRDVEGISAREAYLLSAGPADSSRIYKTEDAGATWTLQFVNRDPAAFYDCFDFWTPNRGLVMSDAVSGRFPVLRTTDGEHWQDIGDRLPAAQEGEAAFAASGTCVKTQGGKRAWIVTGGAPRARVLATTDGGNTWNAYETPVVQGTPSSGILSIDFRDPFHGIIGAGELAPPAQPTDNVATTSDGGRTWTLAARTPFPGAIYGLSYVKGLRLAVVATGPAGAAWSPDDGATWTLLPDVTNYWAVAFAGARAGWLVGTEGRILKISF